MIAFRTPRPAEVAWPPRRALGRANAHARLHGGLARRAWITARRTFGHSLDGLRHRRDVLSLGDLDDRTLRDIGFERVELPHPLGRTEPRIVTRHRD